MINHDTVKQIIGKSLFILSVLMLIFLITSPITHLFTHIDEFFTTTYMNFSIFEIITVTAHDFHPPLYFIIAKIVLDFFNFFGLNFDKLFILKIVSIIPYALILVISFTKIKKDYGWFSAGLFSFAMIMMSEFFFYYLTARMYSWGTLFLILSFLSFKDVIYNDFDKKSLALFTIFSVCCVYTQYFIGISVFVIYVMFFVYILLFEERDKLKYWAGSVFVAFIIYMPWIFNLLAQMSAVKSGYTIPDVTLDSALFAFSTFLHSDVALSIFPSKLIYSLCVSLVLIVFIIIYYWESIDFDDKDSFYIVSGFVAYVGTIVLSIVISMLFKPILLTRYLVPVTGVLWLVISILINKIRNKKLFVVYSILIVILLIAAVSDVVSYNDILYEKGMVQQEVYDSIAQDNNSVVIISSIPLFVHFSDQWNVYSTGIWAHNLTKERVHQVYNFKDLDKNNVTNFIKNNSDKNIYYACWASPELDGNITKIPMLHIPQWNIYNVSSEPINKSDYYNYDNGTIDSHNDIWKYLNNPTLTRNTDYTSITDDTDNGYIQINIIDNYKIEFDMRQYGGEANWGIEFYNSSSSLTGFSLANFNAQSGTWYHVEIIISNGTVNTTINNYTKTQPLENPTHFLFAVCKDTNEIQFKNFKAYPL